jgi:hypothetical protein
MVIVPPRHYCIIENPIVPGLQVDSSGQVQLSHADHEIRLAQPPFPLYPGEILKLEPTKLQVIIVMILIFIIAFVYSTGGIIRLGITSEGDSRF